MPHPGQCLRGDSPSTSLSYLPPRPEAEPQPRTWGLPDHLPGERTLRSPGDCACHTQEPRGLIVSEAQASQGLAPPGATRPLRCGLSSSLQPLCLSFLTCNSNVISNGEGLSISAPNPHLGGCGETSSGGPLLQTLGRARGRVQGAINTSRVTLAASTCHLDPSSGTATPSSRSLTLTLGQSLEKPALLLEGGWGAALILKEIKLSSLPITHDKLTTAPTAQQL